MNAVSGQIVDAAMKVHTALGPGLLESAYEACLVHELRKRGLRVRTQVQLPIIYDSMVLEAAYRLDLLVEECVLVELKTIVKLAEIHEAQLLTYLRFSNHRIGLMINFHSLRLMDGIKRMVNHF